MAETAADHKDHVRSHYDAHAQHNIPTHQALKLRKQGAALPLKRYHNDIKRQLLLRFARPGSSLLDLCCGRGGDLHKWKEAGVSRVLGVDISPNELAEAARRFRELQSEGSGRKGPPLRMDATFTVCSTLGEAEFSALDGPYDVVTCMFAMHYFFEAERSLRMFLYNVSRNLKPGGYFIATIPDGKRVLWHLAGRDVFASPMLRIEKRWEGAQHEVRPFGNGYLWALSDTVTAGAGESEGSLEFLTFTTPIIRIAAHYDMLPVADYQDERLEGLFEPEDRFIQPFKHFFPNFPESDPSLMVASSAFMACVFKKIEEGETMPMLHPPLPKTLPQVLGDAAALEQHGVHEQGSADPSPAA